MAVTREVPCILPGWSPQSGDVHFSNTTRSDISG
jgi:hypothetical protein